MGRAADGRTGARIVGAAAEDQWSAAGGWGKLLFNFNDMIHIW